jgi:hypothetical protein
MTEVKTYLKNYKKTSNKYKVGFTFKFKIYFTLNTKCFIFMYGHTICENIASGTHSVKNISVFHSNKTNQLKIMYFNYYS